MVLPFVCRSRIEGKSGRKKPRLGDVDFFPAPDSTITNCTANERYV